MFFVPYIMLDNKSVTESCVCSVHLVFDPQFYESFAGTHIEILNTIFKLASKIRQAVIEMTLNLHLKMEIFL